ncbi:MAG: hypothetical protein S0880_14110 [Actinomycetota bacterium]|nr:hypothetical protein [Actinomycetota bacterium]
MWTGTRSAALAAVLVGVLLALGGCANEPIDGDGGGGIALPSITLPGGGGDDGGDGGGDAPATTASPATTSAPATTAAPAPEPAQPVPDDPDNAEQDGLDAEDWILLALIAVGVVAIVALVANASARHGQRQARTETDRRTRLDSIVGNCRWIHDHASLELVGVTDVEQLASTWPQVRQRILGTEADISAMAATDARLAPQLTALGRAVSSLRSSLETYVGFRTKPHTSGQDSLMHAATDSVVAARRELSSALAPFAAPVPV